MQTRAGRFAIVVLLLAAAAAAAFSVTSTEARAGTFDTRRQALDAVVNRIASALTDIAAAQKAYVAYGMRDETSLVDVAEAIRQMTAEAARLRASDDYSGEATARLEQVWTALSALSAAEAASRERLAAGEALAAADLLLTSTQPHVTSLTTNVRAFRAAEVQWLETQRRQLAERTRVSLGLVAGVWLLGLVLLARVPRPPPAIVLPADPVPAGPALSTPPPPPSVDLAAAAEACIAIARLTDTARLPSTLERAAEVLDARGIIVWLAAGDTLFAAAGYGYEPAVLDRLRPIDRAADNATAATWRTGEPHVVAGEGSTPGAIVAPMFAPQGCVGVFAAEVRHGREADAATRAAATILATQLAGVLAPWPGTSTSADEISGPGDSTPTGDGSDRQAAAS